MLKRFYTNAIAKKASIFMLAFVITGILLGNWYANKSDQMVLKNMASSSIEEIGHVTEPATHSKNLASKVEAKPKSVQKQKPESNAKIYHEPPTKFQAAPQLATEAQREHIASPIESKQESVPAEGFVFLKEIPLSYDLQQHTYNRCVQLGLDYELVLALMWRESRFQVDAVNINTNGTQDSGIMQINDVNRTWLLQEHGIHDLMDPIQNIDAGTTMLGKLINKYGEHDALMAYQYGEQGMRQKQEAGIITNDKITLLMNKRSDFRNLIEQTKQTDTNS